MEVYLVRHAIAMDRAEFGETGNPDSQRPLTSGGRKRFSRNAHRLAGIFGSVDLIISSPFVRALETANILASHLAGVKLITCDDLAPAVEPAATAKAISALMPAGTGALVVVGHEPNLSRLAEWLLSGGEKGIIILKKGSCLSLELQDGFRPQSAKLRWLVTQKILVHT